MSSTLIRGKHVITKVIDSTTSEVITDGAVFQQDGEIIEVGKYDVLKNKYRADEVIGSGQQVVMPGLIDDHHHVGLTPFQLGNPDLSLESWIATRQATRDVDTYLDTMYGAIDMIQHGVTSVLHMWSPRAVLPGHTVQSMAEMALTAYKDIGMRAAFSYGVKDVNRLNSIYEEEETFLATIPESLADRIRPMVTQARLNFDEYQSMFSDLSDKYQHDPLVKLYISPGNVQWCSDELLGACKEMAAKYDTGMHIHLQESPYQRIYGERKWGKTPLAHLHDLEFLGPEVTCGHSVWLSENDIDILKETRTIVCHNPSSNLRLKSGIAPVNRLLAEGITVAMGQDEAGINDDRDMFQEMRLAQKLHRVPGISSPVPTSHQILQMATINSAKAIKMEDKVGSLEAGKRADVLLVDMTRMLEPYLDVGTNIVDAVLHRAKGMDVDTTIIDGVPVMRDRKFTRISKEDIFGQIAEELSLDLRPEEVERKELAAEFVPYVERFYENWEFEPRLGHQTYNAL